MSYAKKEGYAPAHVKCSFFALALTHPVRICILDLLHEKPMTHEEISRRVPLSESTVSHHLRILYERGLIRYAEQHPWIYYSLDEEGLRVMRREMEACLGPIWGE